MSSSVFFKFKSQKEPSRVAFDGSGISVFELKRQIITINHLGDGTDFELHIYNQDTNEEYTDDTIVIPRATSVIARRLPAQKHGRGSAARYVSGQMPSMPNSGRREKFAASMPAPQLAKAPQANGNSSLNMENMSEEERIAAMLQESSADWQRTQEQMANQAPVYKNGSGFRPKQPPNVPKNPVPAGYVCYRCGEKGHWIQACPTNSDPTFDGRPRIKRTTGIPRSFLKTIDKPVAADSDDTTSSSKQSVMVNADGEYVVAVADSKSWATYQKKANGAEDSAAEAEKEIAEAGVGCPICRKVMKEAEKTGCCGKTYCAECIQTALLDSDFVCPGCEEKDVLLASLVGDEDVREKVRVYLEKRAMPENQNKISETTVDAKSNSPTPPPTATNSPPTALAGTKRKATDSLGPEVPRGPAAMRNQSQVPPSFQQQFPNHGKQSQAFPRAGYNFNMMMAAGMPFMNMNMNPYMNPMMMVPPTMMYNNGMPQNMGMGMGMHQGPRNNQGPAYGRKQGPQKVARPADFKTVV